MHIDVYICIYMFMYIFVSMYVCIYVYAYIKYMCIYMDIYIYIYIYIYFYRYIYVYVYVYIILTGQEPIRNLLILTQKNVRRDRLIAVSNVSRVPIKGLRFGNCKSFLDFHKSFFENIVKIPKSFSCFTYKIL